MPLLCVLLLSAFQAHSNPPPEKDEIAHFDTLVKRGQYDQALPLLRSYTERNPDSWQAWYQLGYVEFRLHQFLPSVTALSKSLTIHEDFAQSHKILAFDLNILGRKDLAIAELQKTIRLDPHAAESYYELGRIYYDQGSYVKAADNLKRAEAIEPAMVKVHHNLGLAYFAIGKSDEAKREFEEGLRLNAEQKQPSAWPLIDYASFFNQQNDYARARDMLLRAIQIDPRWDQAFDELSKAYRGLGEPEQAITALKQAVVLNPSKPAYHYALSRLYSQVHDSRQAKQELAEYERVRKPNAGNTR